MVATDRSALDADVAAFRKRTAIALGVLVVFAALHPAASLLGFALMGVGTSAIFPLAMSAAAQRHDRPAAINVAALSQLSFMAFLLAPPLLGFVAEHPETLEAVYLASNSGRMESLTFVAPMAYTIDWLIFFSDKSKVLTFGVVTVFGVVAGSFLCALIERSFRWEGFRDTRDTALHLVGAALMGVGGVTALGCTVGQGLSGLSTLSLLSAIAVAGIVGGAVLGFKFQMWLLERAG